MFGGLCLETHPTHSYNPALLLGQLHLVWDVLGGFYGVTCGWSHWVDLSEVIVGVQLVFLSEEGLNISVQWIIQR